MFLHCHVATRCRPATRCHAATRCSAITVAQPPTHPPASLKFLPSLENILPPQKQVTPANFAASCPGAGVSGSLSWFPFQSTKPGGTVKTRQTANRMSFSSASRQEPNLESEPPRVCSAQLDRCVRLSLPHSPQACRNLGPVALLRSRRGSLRENPRRNQHDPCLGLFWKFLKPKHGAPVQAPSHSRTEGAVIPFEGGMAVTLRRLGLNGWARPLPPSPFTSATSAFFSGLTACQSSGLQTWSRSAGCTTKPLIPPPFGNSANWALVEPAPPQSGMPCN